MEERSLPASNKWFFSWENSKPLFPPCSFSCSTCVSERVETEVGMMTICGRVGLIKESRPPFIWCSRASAWEVSVLSPVLPLFKPQGREVALRQLLTSSNSGGFSPGDLPSGSSRLRDDSATYRKEKQRHFHAVDPCTKFCKKLLPFSTEPVWPLFCSRCWKWFQRGWGVAACKT